MIHNFYLLVITADIKPPCGEASYLVSYDQQGSMIDTLLISAQGFLTYPFDNNKNRESFTVESIITQDTIHVVRKEKIGGLIKLEGRKRRYRQLTYLYAYVLNKEGKFVLLRENGKDEMIEYELK